MLVWEVLLSMCCFYWLMNELLLTNGLTEYSQDERDIERVKAKSEEAMLSCQMLDETLPSKPQPWAIHRLIEMG